MKVLVCGGRDFRDVNAVNSVLDNIHRRALISLVIHGAAPGADSLAKTWAESRNVPHEPHPAKWDLYGRAAGPMRNAEMLESSPDLVVAFAGGRGTANMIQQAESHGVAIMRC